MPRLNAQRGEVWIVDLGYVAKIRPCVILNVPIQAHERTLIAVVPSTTSISGTRFELSLKAKCLRSDSVLDAQQVGTHPQVRLVRKIGDLTSDQLLLVESAVKDRLGLT